MSSIAIETSHSTLQQVVGREARKGLGQSPRTLSAWLFYDERGSQLFEAITALPEYYLTRTERSLFLEHGREMIAFAAGDKCLTILELGAGSASKTGILLEAAVRRQGPVLYQPIDVSESALAEAVKTLEAHIPGVRVVAQVADYTASPPLFERPPDARVMALYIGSSIGNFFPEDAADVLRNLRAQLDPGDSLLLGTDLAPGANKTVDTLLAAYDDAAGVTATFNSNVLTRLNRELGTDFNVTSFRHAARWNRAESRIEMHLESLIDQRVTLPQSETGPALTLNFRQGETIHTENSYKYTRIAVGSLLESAGFRVAQVWQDAAQLFAVTLAVAA